MATEEQVSKFVKMFMTMGDNLRRTGVYNDDSSRKLVLLYNLINEYRTEKGRPLTITDVSKVTGMALSNVSRFLRPLEEKGYVARRRDGRTVYISITDEGEKHFNEKISEVRGVLNSMLGALTDEEAAVFLCYSDKISAALDNIKNN